MCRGAQRRSPQPLGLALSRFLSYILYVDVLRLCFHFREFSILDSTTHSGQNGTKSNPNRPVPASELGGGGAGGGGAARLLLLVLPPLAKEAACWVGGAALLAAR